MSYSEAHWLNADTVHEGLRDNCGDERCIRYVTALRTHLDGGETGVTVTPRYLAHEGDLASQIIDEKLFPSTPKYVTPKPVVPQELIDRINDEFPKFEADVCDVYSAAQIVLLKKHQDYGPKNISASPGGPLNGLRVRMHDKLARINNLIDSGATPENESLRDSFLDLMNYSAIAMLVLDGNWPEQ